MVERNSKKIILLELTCSFESNIDSANARKNRKYQDLKEDLEARSYNVTLMPFEIGSRGQITKRNRTALADIFKTNQVKIKSEILFKEMSKVSMLCCF